MQNEQLRGEDALEDLEYVPMKHPTRAGGRRVEEAGTGAVMQRSGGNSRSGATTHQMWDHGRQGALPGLCRQCQCAGRPTEWDGWGCSSQLLCTTICAEMRKLRASVAHLPRL